MRRLFLALLLLALPLFTLPQPAAAKSVTGWSFIGKEKAEGWQLGDLTKINLVPQGLHIETETDGHMLRVIEALHPLETFKLTYLVPENTEVFLLWHEPEAGPNEIRQIGLKLIAGETPNTLQMNTYRIQGWHMRPDAVGLFFPAGTKVVIQDFSFASYNILEKAFYAAQSFWSFDIVRAYTVNFLWGPLMVFNPSALNELYLSIPPFANSANIVFYAVLFIGLVTLLFLRTVRARTAFLLLFASLWVFYDLRMTAEFLSYVKTDVAFLYEDPTIRQFRDREQFQQFSEIVLPHVNNREKYVFVSSRPYPFWNMMRYMSYPALPIAPEEDGAQEIDTWLVYKRPDLTLNGDGQILFEGEVVTHPGKKIEDFGNGTFVFRLDP